MPAPGARRVADAAPPSPRSSSRGSGGADEAGERKPSVPAPELGALCSRWQQVGASLDPRSESLVDALRDLACSARASGTPITAVLRALDRLCTADRDQAPDFRRVRAWAGSEVIRAYFDGNAAGAHRVAGHETIAHGGGPSR